MDERIGRAARAGRASTLSIARPGRGPNVFGIPVEAAWFRTGLRLSPALGIVFLTACAGFGHGRGDAEAGAELPLRRGYYVAGDTPCGEASNATLALLRRDGIGGAREFCAFEHIERIGATTFRVTESCAAFQGDDAPAVSVRIYGIPDDSSFTSTADAGGVYRARYCPQSSLPAEWREDDVHELIE